MKTESIVFALGGLVVGLLVGWIVGDQQARNSGPVVTTAAAPAQAGSDTRQPPPLDQEKVKALTTVAQNDPKNSTPRVQLGNLYFDAEQFPEAIKWYEEAYALDAKDANVSTDLGVAYYYSNQPDKALTQFGKSLAIDPKHVKTLLNQGVVLAFAKRDLEGAAKAWQKVVEFATPGSQEAVAAQRGLDSLKSIHPDGGAAPAAN